MRDGQRVGCQVAATGHGSPNHKNVESERFKRDVFHTTTDDNTVTNEREKTLNMSKTDGSQMRKVTFQVANVNMALNQSRRW